MIRFLAGSVLAVSLIVSGVLVAVPSLLPSAWPDEVANSVRAVAAIVLGASASAGLVWLYMRLRLDPIIAAAERLVAGDTDVDLESLGTGPVGRLGRALRSLAQAYATDRDAASTDRLTGVENRHSIIAALSAEVDRASRYHRPLTVGFVDVDHLTRINEANGHRVGDMVLRTVAQTMRNNIRGTDLVGRYGGEEFLLVFTETGVDDSAALAEKLRAEIERQRFELDGRSVSVTVSIGIAGGMGQGVRADTLIRDADAAMYSAKSLGRNQTYVFAEPEEEAGVLRAPISPAGRIRAQEIGQAARDVVLQSLASVIAGLPGDRGRPSPVAVAVATSMATCLELPEAEVERIRVAALLRDIGKVAVPTDLLAKQTALTSSEWRSIVQHPRIAQVILEQATALREAVPLILHHHERYAGHGYPFGLRGDEIPLGARIVAIADAYDAMTHDRPYKHAITHDGAIRELRRNAGTQFDPALVRLFCELFAFAAPNPDPEAVRLLAQASIPAVSPAPPTELTRPAPILRRNGHEPHPAGIGRHGPSSDSRTAPSPARPPRSAEPVASVESAAGSPAGSSIATATTAPDPERVELHAAPPEPADVVAAADGAPSDGRAGRVRHRRTIERPEVAAG